MLSIALHGLAMSIFLLMAYRYPRYPVTKFLNRESYVNIATGLGVFVIAKPIVMLLQKYLSLHIFELPFTSDIARFVVCFIIIDFLRYCLHFVHHRVPFFWQFHAVHHSSEYIDATSGLRMHIFDFLQLSMIPILLFGVLIDTTSFAQWVLPVSLGIGVFFDSFQHANLRFSIDTPFGRIWHSLLNNPHFHVWHHIRNGDEQDGNYGNSLLIWDRIFGTEVTGDYVPTELGLKSFKALQENPIALQLLRKREV
jgi:sterol desaturase/sphingolipid hydroxylase (fatty acid hydroxylase superfamily)